MSALLPSLRVGATALIGLSFAAASQAALFDRGGGLVYDSTLNVTWLANALPAVGSALDLADGQPWGDLTWDNAMTFAANYSHVDSVRHRTWDDWRLPAAAPMCGATVFNCSSNELGHLYYVDFNLPKPYAWTSPFAPGRNEANLALFTNLQNAPYWNGELYASDPSNVAWAFSSGGQQIATTRISPNYVMLVRDGDVISSVPEPETYALMLMGMGVLGTVLRRQRRRQD